MKPVSKPQTKAQRQARTLSRIGVATCLVVALLTVALVATFLALGAENSQLTTDITKRLEGFWYAEWQPAVTKCTKSSSLSVWNGSFAFNATTSVGDMSVLAGGDGGKGNTIVDVRLSVSENTDKKTGEEWPVALSWSGGAVAGSGSDDEESDATYVPRDLRVGGISALSSSTAVAEGVAKSGSTPATITFFDDLIIITSQSSDAKLMANCPVEASERIYLKRKEGEKSFWDRHWMLILFIIGFIMMKGYNGYASVRKA